MTQSRSEEVAGFVLAGGRSSRMGRDKALLEIAGEPLVVRTARTLEPLVHTVTVVGPPETFAPLGLSAVSDDSPGCGPLGGIATALRVARCPWSLIVACDLPYLHAAWLEYLIGRALASAADVLLPESATGPEPLCALYHRRASAAIRAALDRGVRKISEALAELDIERVSAAESCPFDTEGLLFQNLNKWEDYEAARARLERHRED